MELFVSPNNLEALPQLPENSVESLKTATAMTKNVMIAVLDALFIQQWPTVEQKPKLMTELVVAVHELVRGVSQYAIVAIRLPASQLISSTKAACVAGPPKKWVMQHTNDKGILLPNPMEKEPSSPADRFRRHIPLC